MLDNERFILSSVTDILQETANISQLNCNGIESYPLQEYILQTTFMKMTGYSEQKLKCICWDIASIDYDFRYQVYHDWKFGECSSLEDKTKIYKKLVDKIKEYDSVFNVFDYIKNLRADKDVIICESFEICKKILQNSSLRFFNERDFYSFVNDYDTFRTTQEICRYSNKKSFIINDELKSIYDCLYKQRNRCVHNLKSYQQNLPRITQLLKQKGGDNYFYFFTVLTILDKIFIALYKKLLDCVLKNNW